MKKILIIGNAGAGKTTFARELAQKLELPLVHLDKLFWHGEWQRLSNEEFDSLLQKELEKPEWILDGNFHRTLSHRIKYCDTVIFFDFSIISCLWGITKRLLLNYGKSREDMGGNCIERFDSNKATLYRNVLNFNKKYRRGYYSLLNESKDVQVVVFRKRKQVRSFFEGM